MAQTEAASTSTFQRMQPYMTGARRFVGRGLAFLGAGAAVSSALITYARYQAAKAERSLPEEFVLELDLGRLGVVEKLPTNPLQFLQSQGMNKIELRKVVKALELAGEDTRVRAVLTRVGPRENLGGMATVQELRAAYETYAKAAKQRGGAPSIAHAPAFGEAGSNGTVQYYLASVCDQVYMQPTGTLGLLGVQAQQLFFRGLLDKLKVDPIFYTREDYKTAANMFTQSGFTPQHRENTQALLKSLAGQMWRGIGTSRGLLAPELQAAVAAAPLLPLQAGTPISQGGHGLLDGTKYLDQVLSALEKSSKLQAKEKLAAEKAGKGLEGLEPRLPRVPLSKYLTVKELSEASKAQSGSSWFAFGPWSGWTQEGREAAKQEAAGGLMGGGSTPSFPPGAPKTSESAGWVPKALGKGKPKVAVIHCAGTIVQGPVTGPPGGPPGQQVIDATRLSAELDKLCDARDVMAVVLRIDSPGGSALGSDTLHHALLKLKESGKKLVVSCGNLAASGGMFMAVAGDRIVVQPGTLTGSIGVITGKVDASGLMQAAGVTPASIEEGSPNLTLLSPFTKPDQQQEGVINKLMDSIYDDFLSKVAAGRGMSVDEVKKLAGGRVYTGEQAQQIGLADDLGGLKDAVATAKKLAGLPEQEDQVVVFEYPPRKVPLILQWLRSTGFGNSDAADMVLAEPGVLPRALATLAGIVWPDAGVQAAGSTLAQGTALLAPHAPEQARRVLAAAQSTIAAAGMLDGVVCCYSPEAHVLSGVV